MKSDVSSIQRNQTRKVSYTEVALLAVILLIATKFCTLPSVLAGITGSKAIWAVLILSVIELTILFFSVKTAKCGGLLALPMKRALKVPLLLLFLAFFALKLAAFTREISTYFALSLFENIPVLPVMILLLVSCSLIARKGYMAIGRLAEIFLWLFVFVLLFVLIFTRTEGDFFNALAMFSPDLSGLGKGVFCGLAWFGDGAMLSFLDLRGETRFSPHARGIEPPPAESKAKRRIAFAAAFLSVLLVVIFFAVFTSSYGDAAKMTDYAFIKLSAFKANTDELGSADWPVIILWSILSCLYVALLLLSGAECLNGLRRTPQKKKSPISFSLLGGAAIPFALFFLDEEGDYSDFMTRVMCVITLVAALAAIGVGVYSLIRARQGGSRENEN